VVVSARAGQRGPERGAQDARRSHGGRLMPPRPRAPEPAPAPAPAPAAPPAQQAVRWQDSEPYKVLIQQVKIKGIAFSVTKSLFPRIPGLPDRVWGEFVQWNNKLEGRVSLLYSDGADTDTIDRLLQHGLRFEIHPTTNKRPPTLAHARPFQPAPDLATSGDEIKLSYEGVPGLGGARGEQVWKKLQNEQGVTHDNRAGDRFNASMKVPKENHNSLYGGMPGDVTYFSRDHLLLQRGRMASAALSDF
jgi:hypothetical protein